MSLSKIVSIKKVILPKSNKYDLTVDKNSYYFANNILHHNTDGVQLSFSWKDNEFVCARNKSHLKNKGEAALKAHELKEFFKGKGEIEKAFAFAVDDLSDALRKLSPTVLKEFFDDGRFFMSTEIMYSKTENSVPYGVDLLVFHGLIEYNEKGEPLGMDKKQGIKLGKIIEEVNANIGKVFKIEGPNPVDIIKSAESNNKADEYLKQLDKLQKEFKLKDSDQVVKYHYSWFKNFLLDKAKEFKYNIPDETLDALSKRFGESNKSAFKATDFKTIENRDFAEWLEDYNKTKYEDDFKANVRPFEMIFFKAGVYILKSLSHYLVFNKDAAKAKMKIELDQALKQIEKLDDEAKVKKVALHLKKIEDMGGIDEVTPTEGVVFFYKEKLYKLPGLFSSYHQIVSTIKFG